MVTLLTRNLWRKLRGISVFTTVTVRISKTKTKRLTVRKKIGEKFNLSVAEAEVKFRKIRTVYGRYLKRLRTTPSGSGRDAVPREFQNLEWLNPHIAHRPSSTNLISKSPGTVESSSSPASDNEDDFSAEVGDESGESIIGKLQMIP